MTSNDYTRALDKALEDLEDRVQRRDLLNAEIAGFRETVRVLANRIPVTPEKQKRIAQLIDLVDYATPSLTDSIRTVLARSYPQGKTAIEVRNALEESGFNFDDFSNSLSACHAALTRMLNGGEVEPLAAKEGKAVYRRVLRLSPIRLSELPPPDWEPIYSSNKPGDEKPRVRVPFTRKKE
jgi:hypothetical protein